MWEEQSSAQPADVRVAESTTSSNDANDTPKPKIPPTACLSCRAARQKCDRKQPCSRCMSQSFTCEYPLKSNRGRKRGSTNKPDTVEKLLARIADSAIERDLAAALLGQRQAQNQNPAPMSPDATTSNEQDGTSASERGGPDHGFARHSSVSEASTERRPRRPALEPDVDESVCSPLHILAAAVAAERPQTESHGSGMGHPLSPQSNSNKPAALEASSHANVVGQPPGTGVGPYADGQLLARYFASRDSERKDWEILGHQPLDNPFRMAPAVCDPLAAGLLSEKDITDYFELFYQIRHPVVGLLDPSLHIPQYVHETSFTLFSVICALGSAVSTRPRDRLLAPLLYSMAEQNIKWSILNSVKSLETIQAILSITYWARACEHYSDDPSWLRLGHAIQLARELGIHRPAMIVRRVNLLRPPTPEQRERLIRNYQRTWLFVFIMDKSWGMTTGRTLYISWRDIPSNVGDWLSYPSASANDHVTIGIVEMRVTLLKALEDHRRQTKRLSDIVTWHHEAFTALESVKNKRCAARDSAVAIYLPVLSFYIHHGMLVLNAHASRDLCSLGLAPNSAESASISEQTFNVAMKLIDIFLFDPLMVKLAVGVHNMQLINVCHAATEIFQAIKTWLPQREATRAADKICLTADRIEKIAKALPTGSWPSLYLDFFRFLTGQLDSAVLARRSNQIDQGSLTNLWSGMENLHGPDFPNLLDINAMFEATAQGCAGEMGTVPGVGMGGVGMGGGGQDGGQGLWDFDWGVNGERPQGGPGRETVVGGHGVLGH